MAEVPKLSMTNKTQGDGEGLKRPQSTGPSITQWKNKAISETTTKKKKKSISCKQQLHTLVRLPKLAKVANIKYEWFLTSIWMCFGIDAVYSGNWGSVPKGHHLIQQKINRKWKLTLSMSMFMDCTEHVPKNVSLYVTFQQTLKLLSFSSGNA